MSNEHKTIDAQTIEKIAHLARIRVTDAEKEKFAKEVDNTLHWIEQLNSVNTDGVEPLITVGTDNMPRREDKVSDAGYADRVLKNAPESAQDFFVVPKVID
ncbi:MAG: Asp-tRNA(Asn)/Glu-tRNA(Gln) amidotransferase subunit GatC [Alphaproteobacteria bacterium]